MAQSDPFATVFGAARRGAGRPDDRILRLARFCPACGADFRDPLLRGTHKVSGAGHLVSCRVCGLVQRHDGRQVHEAELLRNVDSAWLWPRDAGPAELQCRLQSWLDAGLRKMVVLPCESGAGRRVLRASWELGRSEDHDPLTASERTWLLARWPAYLHDRGLLAR